MESMAEGMIKDLVASGHALADDMTGAPSVLIRCLAAQLEVQLVRANALAAENAKLKKFCKDAAFDADYEAELGMERGGFSDALNEIKTPATDAFLAEVRAQGVEMCSAEIQKQTWDEREGDGMVAAIDAMEIYAAQLRKERG